MYLLDSDIPLELLLGQERAGEVERLLRKGDPTTFFMTDFALHSIGVVAFRRGERDALVRMTNALCVQGSTRLVTLQPEEMKHVAEASRRFGLDFDDAYQYAAAERFDLEIVSFDADFDGTERGRLTPADVLARLAG